MRTSLPPGRLGSWLLSLGLLLGHSVGLVGCGAEHPLQLGPERGGQAGGDAVQIHGEDFTGHGPVAVYFGPRAAKAIVIASPWLITVLTPQSDEAGSVDVTLRFGDGDERVLEGAFSYEDQPGIVLRPELGGQKSAPPAHSP